MISTDLRIRLEGRVEALEREVLEWEGALSAARAGSFRLAGRMLAPPTSPVTGAAGLELLLARRETLRNEVQQVVVQRLRLLGMPDGDPALGACWLMGEPVLYEHRRVPLGFLVRAVHVAAFLIVPSVALLRCLGVPVGVVLFLLVARRFGWSQVVLTPRRLVLEGDVIDLTAARQVLVVRPFLQWLPLSFAVEVRSDSGPTQHSRIKCASRGLRVALEKLGLDTGNDWGPW